ncbi:MAG: DUF2269 family protein [Trueperaceae bacterium]
MLTLYTLFKYIHIVAAIIWIGGVVTLSIFNVRIACLSNLQALQVLVKEGNVYGRMIVGPAAALTLVAGIITATRMGVSFNSLWIIWGFVAIFLSFIWGATLTRMTTNQLAHLMTTAPNSQQINVAQNRLIFLNSLDILEAISKIILMQNPSMK